MPGSEGARVRRRARCPYCRSKKLTAWGPGTRCVPCELIWHKGRVGVYDSGTMREAPRGCMLVLESASWEELE